MCVRTYLCSLFPACVCSVTCCQSLSYLCGLCSSHLRTGWSFHSLYSLKTAAYVKFMSRSVIILISITDLTADIFIVTFFFFLSLNSKGVLSVKQYFTEVMSKDSLTWHICYRYDTKENCNTLSFCLAVFFSSHVLCAVHPIMEISLKLFWRRFKALNIL